MFISAKKNNFFVFSKLLKIILYFYLFFRHVLSLIIKYNEWLLLYPNIRTFKFYIVIEMKYFNIKKKFIFCFKKIWLITFYHEFFFFLLKHHLKISLGDVKAHVGNICFVFSKIYSNLDKMWSLNLCFKEILVRQWCMNRFKFKKIINILLTFSFHITLFPKNLYLIFFFTSFHPLIFPIYTLSFTLAKKETYSLFFVLESREENNFLKFDCLVKILKNKIQYKQNHLQTLNYLIFIYIY